MTAQPTAAVSAARAGNFAVFGVSGFVFATWMSRLPDVKQSLALTPGGLGALLLGISGGAALGLPLAGRVAHRFGAANTVRLSAAVALLGICLAAVLVQVHASMYAVMIGLFVLGLGNGVWDLAQNLEGTIIEQALARAIMPWFHAAFSAGTVVAALLGAAMTWLSVPVVVHVGAAAVAGVVVMLWVVARFLSGELERAPVDSGLEEVPGRPVSHRRRSAWLEARTVSIGLMVLAAAFTEGTANDWLAVAFVDGHDLPNALGVVAASVFFLFMTAGRILGTGLLDRYGRVPVLQVLFAAAVVGSVLVIFGNPLIALAGAGIWGLGASLGFPVGMSGAADDPMRAAMRLSVVATLGYLAFLAGPPLLGFLGDRYGTLHALLVVGAVSTLAILIALVAKPLELPQVRSATRSTDAPGR